MVVFDACVFSIAIYDNAGIPNDYRSGKPIDRARERIDELIKSLESDGDCILLPAPALGEALASVAEHAEQYIAEIEQNHCFKIHPFGKREAIEIAVRTKAARSTGDKKEGVDEPWQKMKYDRQIVASAKTEGATVIYSTDKHIHAHAGLWGIRVIHIADLPLPASQDNQQSLIESEDVGDTSPQQPHLDSETPEALVNTEGVDVPGIDEAPVSAPTVIAVPLTHTASINGSSSPDDSTTIPTRTGDLADRPNQQNAEEVIPNEITPETD